MLNKKWILLTPILVLMGSIHALAANISQVYVMVGKEHSTAEWAKEKCQMISEGLNLSSRVDITCNWRQKNSFFPEEISKAHRTAQFEYFIDYLESSKTDGTSSGTLRIVNWNKIHETDFDQTMWDIKTDKKNELQTKHLLSNLISYSKFKPNIYFNLLKEGIDESDSFFYDEKNDIFKSSITHEPISIKSAVGQFTSQSKQKFNYVRAAIEIVMALGAGTVNYYRDDRNKRDWDYTLKESIDKKILSTEGVRFDDNSSGVNRDHSLAGVVYYNLCRSNGAKNYQAALCTLAASSLWEYGVEYREVMSINDQVFTVIGGATLGETLTLIGRYLQTKGNSPWKRALRYLVDPATGLNRALDVAKSKLTEQNISEEAFNMDLTGKLEFFTSYDHILSDQKNSKNGANNKSAISLGVQGQIINIGGYENPGKEKIFLPDTLSTDFKIKNTVTNSIPNTLEYLASVVWAGKYRKNLKEDSLGRLYGYNWFIGPATGFQGFQTYDGNKTKDENDFMMIVNMVGAKAVATVYKGETRMQVSLELFEDFAMVRSLVIDEYRATNDMNGLPSVIKNNSYYYALGNTLRGHVIVEFGKNWELGAQMSYSQEKIINGRYRFQDQITKNIDASDSYLKYGIYIDRKILRDLSLRAEINQTRRTGEIKDVTSDTKKVTTVSFSINYLF